MEQEQHPSKIAKQTWLVHMLVSIAGHEVAGLSLRFQVAGYLLLVAGEVASSHGALQSILIGS